jgi:hypothetical protein
MAFMASIFKPILQTSDWPDLKAIGDDQCNACTFCMLSLIYPPDTLHYLHFLSLLLI